MIKTENTTEHMLNLHDILLLQRSIWKKEESTSTEIVTFAVWAAFSQRLLRESNVLLETLEKNFAKM